MSLRHTNDMLRAQGFNVPFTDDNDPNIVTRYDYLTGTEVRYYTDEDERSVMSAAGWDVDSTPVDVFMEAPTGMVMRYAQAMERDNDSGDYQGLR